MKVAYVSRTIDKGAANLLPILNCLPQNVEWKLFTSKSDLGSALLPWNNRKELADCDIIHVNTTLYGAFKHVSCPVVCSVHTVQKTEYELDSCRRHRIGVEFEKRTVKNTDKFLTVSHAITEDLLRQYPEIDKDNVEVVRHATLDPQITYNKDFGIKPTNPMLVFASGRLVPRKNFQLLVDCACACRSQDRQQFVLVGEGKELKKILARSSALPNFILNPYMTRKGYLALLSRAFVYVLTSRYEGYPTVVYEAMQAGVPVFSTEIPSVRDMIIHGKTGLYFSSARDFADKLRMLVWNETLYNDIKTQARLYVESQPTAKEIASKFVQVYEGLL